MNAFHMRMLALLAAAAGIAQADQTPPTPPAPPTPPTPAGPPTPSTPAALPSEMREQARQQLEQQRERELQRAQEQLNRAAREVAELSAKLGEDSWTRFGSQFDFGPGHGAMLGINIGAMAHGHADETADGGVRILSVSPGGPADEAGLKANDVIVSLAGKPLKGDKDKDLSPAQQLQSQMRHLEPGTAIELEYRRDGKLQKVEVTAKSPEDINLVRVGEALQNLKNIGPIRFEGPFWMDRASGFGSAELADLSPGLGRYFGTDKGLLVVRAPKDDRLKLQDGDVILDIDGRPLGNPSHAYEVLSTYHSGETLKLHVMRQQKKLELSVEIPEDGHSGPARLRAEGFPLLDLISPRLLADL